MQSFNIQDCILYEDKDILVCHKPAGVAVQSARFGMADMESSLKNHLALKTPGKMPYLGIIHRLDQPVEGVLVFAKTPKAAAELNRQITSKTVTKEYLAVTAQLPEEKQGHLEDYLKKDNRPNSSSVVTPKTPGAKKASLDYSIQEEIKDERTATGKRILVKIILDTGRHHQIRVQLSHEGLPLLGDRKYNPSGEKGTSLGLCSSCLEFKHPRTGKMMKFETEPQGSAFLDFVKKV